MRWLLDIVAVLALRLAALCLRGGALQPRWSDADDFNDTMAAIGRPERTTPWRIRLWRKNLDSARLGIQHGARLPVFPWEHKP